MPLQTPDRWISPQHLSAEAIRHAAVQFSQSPHQTVWLDDFLLPQRVLALRALFASDGDFKEIYELTTDGKKDRLRRVSAEEWQQAAPDERFDHGLRLDGLRPEARMNPGSLTYALFRNFIQSSAGLAYLGQLVGMDLGAPRMLPRIMRPGDAIARHNDCLPTRGLCALFYLCEGWHPSFGGRFRQYHTDHPPQGLDPLPNRFVLFRPHGQAQHDVEPLTEAAAGWQRWSITLWFSGVPAPIGQIDVDAPGE